VWPRWRRPCNTTPDIDVRYTRVTFLLSTHDSGGITAKDFELATRIEQLAAEP
jgi:4a-hydroxytetrahydrobiopterin dehydratase